MSNKPEEKKLEPFKWSEESDEELRRLIEESRASINWAEVAKWDAEGRPYEEHEEILLLSKESDEELKKLIEESRASINWTEVAKWDAERRPYEEHEEILLFLNKDNKDELINLGSTGTGQFDINERRKQIHGDTSHTSSRKRNYTSGKESDSKNSTKESTTTERNHRQYRSKEVIDYEISSEKLHPCSAWIRIGSVIFLEPKKASLPTSAAVMSSEVGGIGAVGGSGGGGISGRQWSGEVDRLEIVELAISDYSG
ncbi:16586_t:CDS:2, partial [Funneliformis caledonium]